MASDERLRELEERYEGYTVYDNRGSKIGKVDDLFVDEKDHEEYIGVKMGFFGLKSTLIPTEIVRVNENDRTIEVSESKDHIKNAPSFDDDEDVTTEYEERIRSHFGLESLGTTPGRGSYGASTGAAAGTSAAAGSQDRDEDHETGHHRDEERHEDDRRAATAGTHDEDRESSGGTFETDQDTSSGTTDSAVHDDRESHEESGTTGTSGESTRGTEATSETPPPGVRQTEETETFEEGGRTKIRRRIVREEIVDADERER